MADDPFRQEGKEEKETYDEDDDFCLFDFEEMAEEEEAQRNGDESQTNPPTILPRNVSRAALLCSRTESSSNLLLMKRVGSTFFSVSGSVASDLDLLEWTSTTTAAAANNTGRSSPPGQTNDDSENFHRRKSTLSFVTAAPSFENEEASDAAASISATAKAISASSSATPEIKWNVADILYHDIMMTVFSFLPATSLASFSESGRRPNNDVFSFLRLQLERAILLDPISNGSSVAQPKGCGDEDRETDENGTVSASGRRSSFLSPTVDIRGIEARQHQYGNMNSRSRSRSSTCPIAFSGAGILSRIATLDRALAERLVEDYRNIPRNIAGAAAGLSASPVLRADAAFREFQHRMIEMAASDNANKGKAAASCAVVFTVLSAANRMMIDGGGLGLPSVPEASAAQQAALIGCAGLGLVATRRYAASASPDSTNGTDNDLRANGEANGAATTAADRMARRMQQMLMRLPRAGEHGLFPVAIVDSLSRQQLDPRDDSRVENEARPYIDTGVESHAITGRRGKRTKLKGNADAVIDPRGGGDEEKYVSASSSDEDEDNKALDGDTECSSTQRVQICTSPFGCVGSYARVLRKAAEAVTQEVQAERRELFERLTSEERRHITTEFIEAAAENRLDEVKDFVRTHGVDVNGFYVGNDGTTETCALHTAAFNGATDVVAWLCSGIDERDSSKDGGLCDINLVDENSWTALHFAAGADSSACVKVLASFGAEMTVEAANGYTPYHWAERLSNHAAAEELKRLGADERFVFSRQMPLAFLANRFFAFTGGTVAATGV